MRNFIGGMLVTAQFVVALFFLKFWRRSRDGLFAAFAVAFLILAVQRMLLVNYTVDSEPVWIYLLRLVAFLIILGAIIGKNIVPPRRVE